MLINYEAYRDMTLTDKLSPNMLDAENSEVED